VGSRRPASRKVGSGRPANRKVGSRRPGSRKVDRCGGRRRVRRRVGLARSGGRRKLLRLSTDLSMGSTPGSRSSPAGLGSRRSDRRARVRPGRAPGHTLPGQPARTLPARRPPAQLARLRQEQLALVPVRLVRTVLPGAVPGLLGGCLMRTATAGTVHCRRSVGGLG
jgi:hypothetical protein